MAFDSWFCSILVTWIFEGGKTLCKVLMVADTISLPMTDPRVDRKLPRHGSARPSIQLGGNCTGVDCHSMVAMSLPRGD